MKRRFSIVVVSLFVFLTSMTSVVLPGRRILRAALPNSGRVILGGTISGVITQGSICEPPVIGKDMFFPALSGQTEIWLRSACCAPKAATG